MCCATHPPSPVWEWGRTRACHGKGRVWRHPPAQELQNKEQLLQVLLWGVSCCLPAPSFMSCLSCVSSRAMAVSSQHLVPPHCGSPALQEQNWGPLLLSCCANDLGSPLQSLLFLLKASSSSGGETERVSLERDSHCKGWIC